MVTFRVCYWSMARVEETDEEILARNREDLQHRVANGTVNQSELFGGMLDRLKFAEEHGGFARLVRTKTYFEAPDGTLQTVVILVDFPNDTDAVHYRLTFSDEPHAMPADA